MRTEKTSKAPDPPDPVYKVSLDMVWFDTSDVMRIFKISEKTVAKWRKENRLVYRKTGGKYLYESHYILYTMKKGCNEPRG